MSDREHAETIRAAATALNRAIAAACGAGLSVSLELTSLTLSPGFRGEQEIVQLSSVVSRPL